MPVERGEDSRGPFYRWGKQGKKYRYTAGNEGSAKRAKAKATLQGRAAQRKAPASETKAKPAERRRGSRKNKPGSASGTRGGIKISAETEASLKRKVDAHNEENPGAGKRATLGRLKAVYRRGAGAFSTSHSPRVSSRQQWAMARVNAFLYLLAKGRPRNSKYTTDNDLLPKGHPRRPKNG